MNDGVFGIAYQSKIPVSQNDKKSWSEISVETRIYSFKEGGDDGLLFPLECRFRVPISGAGTAEIAQMRAGLFRVMADDVGINLQAFSYLQKTYLNGLGTIRGFEFLDLNVVQELSLKGVPYLALVIKGNASVSFVNLENVSKTQRRSAEIAAGTDHLNDRNFGINTKAGYSVSLRISEKVLLGMTQGFEISAADENKTVSQDEQNNGYGLRYSFIGAEIRYSPLKAMNIMFNIRKDTFEQFAQSKKVKDTKQVVTDASANETTSIPYAGVTFELNW